MIEGMSLLRAEEIAAIVNRQPKALQPVFQQAFDLIQAQHLVDEGGNM
jgi:hypothetical protein